MEKTKIEWTDATFNPWWGCQKVSAGCQFCYAESWNDRFNDPHWGPTAPRKFFGEKHWLEPFKWNREAEKECKRRRVFCASMSDVFELLPETHESFQAMEQARIRLFGMIRATPWLDWQLLTKRPENIVPILDRCAYLTNDGSAPEYCKWLCDWLNGSPPENVWLGTSVENQEQADKRIPHLLEAPARVRFLSCEPLLGKVLIEDYLPNMGCKNRCWHAREDRSPCWNCGGSEVLTFPSIDWVIVGGESGQNARPMHPDWALSLKSQCVAHGTAFLFKQWGEWFGELGSGNYRPALGTLHSWGDGRISRRIGKKKAGRILDGTTWDELPA